MTVRTTTREFFEERDRLGLPYASDGRCGTCPDGPGPWCPDCLLDDPAIESPLDLADRTR